MAILPLIKDPQHYQATTLDLAADSEAREYWIDHSHRHLATLEPLLREQCHAADREHRVTGFCEELRCQLRAIARSPHDFAPLAIHSLDAMRERLLRKHGFADPYKKIKDTENRVAIELYSQVAGEAATHSSEHDLVETLIRNIFAGNMFDMGATAIAEDYHVNNHDFFKTRRSLRPRPWLVDDCDSLAEFLCTRRYRSVMFFVDNAGADLILGALPFAKYLAADDKHVILAANSTPTLNDVTYDELCGILTEIRSIDTQFDRLLAAKQITCVASGCGTPLIDLANVSAECAAAARSCDLLVIEGMGRAIESNYHVEFTAPTLKIAMLKDRHVATSLDGELYDPVCRFEVH